jgi:hypothetical protein
MNDQDRQRRIERAREVLRDIHHVPIATVNEDGSPHASPVLFAFDGKLHGFWASSPTSQHSQNIVRDGRVFLAVFDSRGGHSGLFLSGIAAEVIDQQDIVQGLQYLEVLKKNLYGSGMADLSTYMGQGPQRIYEFIPERAWVNHSERQGGAIIRDQRYEIPLSELYVS